ncbi:MAG TPA: penicillin-binding transpeptidase domain-containing protein, partial [Candidatus Binatia bacterium]|nr:penicillin-binding transpeptidase domain-containing protein [Candidatus Binatia bacterium]
MGYRFNNKQPVQNNSYGLRIVLLLAGITGFIFLIIFRMFNLQIVHHQYYAALASNQHEFEKTILPGRGEIFLDALNGREPVLAATNVTKEIVYANPKEITSKGDAAAKLASVLGMPVQEILDKLSVNGTYSAIKKQVEEDVAEQVKSLNLVGVYTEPETIRYYPEKNLASHVLGFLGFKGNQRVGQYGVEGKFESQLAGSNGLVGLEKDLAGRWITVASRNFVPAQNGDDIHLTIDPAIQYKAQEVLKRTVEEQKAAQGSVIILNPKTGAIMAMANYPDFDPNEYNKVPDISYYTNSSLSADYEPGSVFKPLTIAAAINEGKITPDSTYED